jgi:hypothetical protein
VEHRYATHLKYFLDWKIGKTCPQAFTYLGCLNMGRVKPEARCVTESIIYININIYVYIYIYISHDTHIGKHTKKIARHLKKIGCP